MPLMQLDPHMGRWGVVVAIAACIVLNCFGTGLAQGAPKPHRFSCSDWNRGRVAGYLFWGKATEDTIRECIARFGVNRRSFYGATPLLEALAYSRVPLGSVRLLLDLGADVNIRNKLGVTPLIMAARYGRDPEILRLLIDAGGDPHALDGWGTNAFDVLKINDAINQDTRDQMEKILKDKR